jgi:hypothetical protein
VQPKHLERRRVARGTPPAGQPERRQRLERRPVMGDHLRGGWLTFETDRLRRRLAPIPDGWELMPEAHLEQLCEVATAVRSRGRLIE